MTLFMLDTNTVSYLVRGDRRVAQIAFSKPYEQLCVSCITEAELLYGLERRPEATRKAMMIKDFLERVESLPWERRQAAQFGSVRASMERTGKNIAPVDMMIAVHALSLNAILVTSDAAFRHVPGLAVEDWR